MNIREPFISVPVPTASHDHHAGPARRNHRSPRRLTVSEKVKFCARPPKLETKVLAESSATSASLASSRSADDSEEQAAGATAWMLASRLRRRDVGDGSARKGGSW